ncbi:MAG: hypothetical protein CMJ25_10375 [Phycisphaerae bacterium]|nr:hypothetical protein [Phycisphaerae bacterium]|tara:strand:+ start:7526 stop:7897 length:372 start_codon:yes stop_codon:yes gene_type:complete
MEDKPKKPDGRKNNGAVKGVSRGQGRPKKINNKDTDKLTLAALKKVFGSEDKMWVEVAKMAKDGSSKHWDYIMNYRYGKPKEMQQISIDTKVNIPVIEFARPKEEIIDITPEDERIDPTKNEE